MAFNKRKRDYPWLSGDDSGAYCSPRKRIYHGKCLSSNHGCFITTPFNNWKKSTGPNPADNKLLKHQLSNAHKTAIGIASQSTFLRDSDAGSVLGLLVNASDERKKENLEIFIDFARILHFIVSREQPHTTTYQPLIKLVESCDQSGKISDWFRRAPETANYSSTTIATELLETFGSYIKQQLKNEISKSRYVALMADEATDIRTRQELSVCCHYITETGQSKEALIDVVCLEGTTADIIVNNLNSICLEYDLVGSKVQWQAYDGAANFAGCKNGVQANFRDTHSMARYIHCRSHALNLACVSAANSIPQLKRLFSSLTSLWRFFHLSPKRTGKLVAIQQIIGSSNLSLVQASDSRWSSNYRAVS